MNTFRKWTKLPNFTLLITGWTGIQKAVVSSFQVSDYCTIAPHASKLNGKEIMSPLGKTDDFS